MRVEERLGLAHLAYRHAVGRAREESTPAAWRRLVTAAKNLRWAKHDREAPGHEPTLAPRDVSAKVLIFRLPVYQSLHEHWPELAQELAVSRALIAESRELLRESKRARAELAEVRARWRYSLRHPNS